MKRGRELRKVRGGPFARLLLTAHNYFVTLFVVTTWIYGLIVLATVL